MLSLTGSILERRPAHSLVKGILRLLGKTRCDPVTLHSPWPKLTDTGLYQPKFHKAFEHCLLTRGDKKLSSQVNEIVFCKRKMFILRTCGRGHVRNSVKSFFNSRYSHGGIVQPALDLSPSLKCGYNPWTTSRYKISAKKIQSELHDKIILRAKRFLIKSTVCDAQRVRAAGIQKSYPTLFRKADDISSTQKSSTNEAVNHSRLKGINCHQIRHNLKLSITNFRTCRPDNISNLKLSVLHNIKGLYTKLQDKYSYVTLINSNHSRHFHAMSQHIRNVKDRQREKVRSLKGELSSMEFFNEGDERILTLVKRIQKGRSYSTENNPEDTKPASASMESQAESHGSYAKIRKAMKEYGYTVFVFYFTISTISLWSFYFAITRYLMGFFFC